MFADPKIFYNWSENSRVNVPQHFYNVCMILCRTNDVRHPFSVKLFFRNRISHIKLNFFKITIVLLFILRDLLRYLLFFIWCNVIYIEGRKNNFFDISKWMSNIYAFKLISYSSNDLSFFHLILSFLFLRAMTKFVFQNEGKRKLILHKLKIHTTAFIDKQTL